MCTSTMCEGGEIPWMCLTMKWKPSWMGLQPQQQQYAVVSPSGSAQNSGQLQKACLLIVTVK